MVIESYLLDISLPPVIDALLQILLKEYSPQTPYTLFVVYVSIVENYLRSCCVKLSCLKLKTNHF